MHSKVLSSLLGQRIQPAHKFPQIRLKANEQLLGSRHHSCSLPLTLFHDASVEFCCHELQQGQIVEVRRDDNKLEALGFFEPQLLRVEIFDFVGNSMSLLPTVSEDFFISRVDAAWERRRRLLHQSENNAYRVLNGTVDGVPSLYMDAFSESFVRLVATSAGAERLVPAVTEYLRRRGTEEVLLDTPTVGRSQRLSLAQQTLPMSRMYVESGVRHLWLKDSIRLDTEANRLLLNPAHRRARRMIRDLAKDKRVMCVYDRSGSAAMNATMTAKYVTVVEECQSALKWVQANLVANHSAAVFKSCHTVHSTLEGLELREQYDIVYLEHHHKYLATARQWNKAIVDLTTKKIIGAGTIVIMAQESAPLGIRDLLVRRSSGGCDAERPASRKEIAQTLRDAADTCKMRVRFLRAFSTSCDYPQLPEEDSVCFSLAYLMEGPAI